MLCSSILTAQDATRGVILSEKGKPVRRMSVWVKNSLDGIKTDKQGEYILQGLNEKDTLIISVSKKKDAVIPLFERGDSILIQTRHCWHSIQTFLPDDKLNRVAPTHCMIF